MSVKTFNELLLKFNRSDWSKNPELGLIDTILEKKPEMITLLQADVARGCKKSHFGRKDTPTVEQVIRAAIYKRVQEAYLQRPGIRSNRLQNMCHLYQIR